MTNRNKEEVIPRVPREEKYPGITKCSRPAGKQQKGILYVVSFIKDLLQRGIKIINSIGNNVSSLDNSSIKAKDGKPTTLTQEEFNILMSDNPTKSKPNSNVRDA